jgi:hypothetical protein
MLNKKVLQLLHLMEELDCGGIVQMPSVQEILGQELPVTFKVATKGHVGSLQLVKSFLKLVLFGYKVSSLFI